MFLKLEKRGRHLCIIKLYSIYINVETILKMQISQEMENSEIKNFLIDGFPRNQDNLEGWNEAMKEVVNVQGVFFFNCPDQVS